MYLKKDHLLLILLFVSCSTIEFIPESEYTAYRNDYRKKSWEEVEVIRERPHRPFQIMGDVIIRNQAENSAEEIEERLKKEMWEKKMDGVWMVERKRQNIDGFSLETMDTRGHTTSSYNGQKDVAVLKGFAFRYK